MLWFKHYCDNHEGRTVEALFQEMGHKGLAYFILIEMCAGKLSKHPTEKLTEADCEWHFPVRIVAQKCRLSAANVAKMCRIAGTFGQLEWRLSGGILEIKMPMLLDWLESDQVTPKKRRGRVAAGTRLEESRVEKNISIVQNKTGSDPMGYMKPENEPFVSFLKGLDILSPKVRVEVDRVRASFETVERLNDWVLGVTEARGFKENATNPGRSRYLTAALLREVGAIA